MYKIVHKYFRQIVHFYIDFNNGLENQNKPGNSLSKYSNKKNLKDMENFNMENMKLRIENERLKKDT